MIHHANRPHGWMNASMIHSILPMSDFHALNARLRKTRRQATMNDETAPVANNCCMRAAKNGSQAG